MVYTVMRTGALVDGGASGGGLAVGAADAAVCGEVSKEDVFRFVTEALTMPEASGQVSLAPPTLTAPWPDQPQPLLTPTLSLKPNPYPNPNPNQVFSLCPSEEARGPLREMRMRGCSRRDEVRAVIRGFVADGAAAAVAAAPAEVASLQAMDGAAEPVATEAEAAEVAAAAARDREGELRMLIARARERGAVVEADLKLKEEATLKRRADQAKYYSTPPDSA